MSDRKKKYPNKNGSCKNCSKEKMSYQDQFCSTYCRDEYAPTRKLNEELKNE